MRLIPRVRAGFGGKLTRLFQQHTVATDGGTTVVGEYLDVQARIA